MFNAVHIETDNVRRAIAIGFRSYRMRQALRDEPITSHDARECIHALVHAIRDMHPGWNVAREMPEKFDRFYMSGDGSHIILIGCPKTWGRIILHLENRGDFASRVATLAMHLRHEVEARNREIGKYYDTPRPKAA